MILRIDSTVTTASFYCRIWGSNPSTANATGLPMVRKDFYVFDNCAVSNVVGIGRHRTCSMGVIIPLFHHSIPPNKDTWVW